MESLRDSTRSTSISVASVFMRHVYQWMTVGLLVTAGTAFFVASSPALLSAIFGNTFGLIILAIAVFAMPLVLSGMISRLSAFAATALFVVYSALMARSCPRYCLCIRALPSCPRSSPARPCSAE